MTRSTLSITKTTPLARHGMVVAEHPRGAEVGARILERGGNAVDAAIATNAVMGLMEPTSNGIGAPSFYSIRPNCFLHLNRNSFPFAETDVVRFQ